MPYIRNLLIGVLHFGFPILFKNRKKKSRRSYFSEEKNRKKTK